MDRIITYSLRAGARNSDEYYSTIAAFAADWAADALRQVGDVVHGFRAFRLRAGLPDRTDAELAFEILALGVTLREHGPEAARLPPWSARALHRLLAAQDRWPRAEGAIKAVRGWVSWVAGAAAADRYRQEDIDSLIAWLQAQGQSARAERFSQWRDYLQAGGPAAADGLLDRCSKLAADFAAESARRLGQYTAGVAPFLTEVAPKYRRRYDAELVSRSRLEYHLGMLGTEILSRAYRERFLAAPRKIVIVPPCLRARTDEECKAVQTPFGARCQACTPSCRVHQITKLGEKRGFEVYIIPDELRVFGPGVGGGGLGVVGVACALTNWGGGWEADSMGVPAQGVLLDYVGCRYHWDDEGIATDTNLRKLEEVVGLAPAPKNRL